MRFLQKDLKNIYVFSRQEQESDYVGTEIVDVFYHTIKCNVQPQTSKIIVEAYGVRALNMLTLLCDLKQDVNENMSVSLTDSTKPTHKIVSIKPYNTHKTLLIEVII